MLCSFSCKFVAFPPILMSALKTLTFRCKQHYISTILVTFTAVSCCAATTVTFGQPVASGAPFPSDALTKPDSSTGTGKRINFPIAEDSCASPAGAPQGVCGSRRLLNQLDGFRVRPRVNSRFSGAVDPGTIKDGMKLVSVTSPSSVVPLNQVILNEEQTCVFAKPDRVLNQQSRYLLVITDALTDFQSKPVTPDPGFTSCLQGSGADPYCQDLGHAIQAVRSTGFKENITGASLFTTLSATSWLERAHDFVAAFTPGLVLPAGLRSSFDIADLRSMTWQPDKSGLPPQNIPLDSSGEVGSIGFGLFLSPNFLNTSGSDAGTITTDPAAPISV